MVVERADAHPLSKPWGVVDLHPWSAADTVIVPAGTIHAIGAGRVIAEIQQRSDTTFRLFDYDRQRELHQRRLYLRRNASPRSDHAALRGVRHIHQLRHDHDCGLMQAVS